MVRRTRMAAVGGVAALLGTLFTGWGGVLTATAPAAASISRPLVWVSGQDAGKVFITQGTSVVQTFDFVNGTPAGTPIIGANPKPHLITFSPDAKFAYVTFQGVNGTAAGGCSCVSVIDTVARVVVTTINIPGAGIKTTEAKTSPDGRFLFISQIGNNGSIPGTVTRFAVDEVNRRWTFLNQRTFSSGQGPACFEFSPVTGSVYVDSSLTTFLGVMVVDPVTLVPSALDATIGDPQCGMHDPISVSGQSVIVVTDSGTPTGGANPNLGHTHFINLATDAFTEAAYSPFFARNLHDNWPVQLEPVGAATSDASNIVYMSDRDSDVLKRVNIETGALTNLTMTPPDIVPGPSTCTGAATGTPKAPPPIGTDPCGRGAIDTLDGSGDTVFAAMKETGDLAIIDGFTTQTFLHLVNPVASCSDPTNANFHKCFTVHAVTVEPTHTTQITGPQNKSFVVNSGQSFRFTNAQVNGSIVVNPGGSVIMDNSSANSLSASAPASIRICASTFSGSVSVSHATGFVLVGDPNDDNCAPNRIGGTLTLQSNTGGLDAINNKVAGGISISGNSGAGPFAQDTGPEVSGNGP